MFRVLIGLVALGSYVSSNMLSSIEDLPLKSGVVWGYDAFVIPRDERIAATPSAKSATHGRSRTPGSLLSIDDKKDVAIAFVKKQMKLSGIPGMAVSVVVGNETILSKGFGTQELGNSKRLVSPDTLFEVGALSEVLIALALGKLGETHKIEWSDTVKSYLPWFILQDKYAEEHTTIEDLLLKNTVFGIMDGNIPGRYGVFPTNVVLVQALGHLKTKREFRSGSDGSVHNYAILSQVIEAVTKTTWFEYVKAAVLKPLGMKNTFGSPSDVVNKEEVSFGHFYCNGTTIGPYNIFNSSMVETFPSNYYAAVVTSIDDMTKLSHALLHHGKPLFHSSKTLNDMLVGHNIHSFLASMAKALGYTEISESTQLNTGIGFDLVANIMENQLYFDKNGGGNSFASAGGWLPIQQVGVILLGNSQGALGKAVDMYRVYAMRSYLVQLFKGIPVEKLDREFDDWVAWINQRMPELPCDAHYFNGVPWETPGVVIPESTKQALVGKYCAMDSFSGNLTIARRGEDLTLQYGAYTRPLIATKQGNLFVWALERGAMTSPVFVSNIDQLPRIKLLYNIDFARCD
ncbi:hypothetical protein AC1031_002518 [Aphanomyces cochlioides]|nr:hypothetical protein AC1031_002518 [Aphanomyces cochlioides]